VDFARHGRRDRAHTLPHGVALLSALRAAARAVHAALCVRSARARLAAPPPPPPAPTLAVHELKALRAYVLNARADRHSKVTSAASNTLHARKRRITYAPFTNR
jgi:hypothetical protein